MRILIILLLSFSSVFALKAQAPAIFPQAAFRAVYKTHIQYKEKDMSGLLLIRQGQDSTFRIAFVTEVGMKIFEFKFYPRKKHNFEMISILSWLDRKIIINTLRRDFESLFMTFAAYTKARQKDNTLVYCHEGKRIYSLENGRITTMLRKHLGLKKEEISITNTDDKPVPVRIGIQHLGAELSIKMELIKFE